MSPEQLWIVVEKHRTSERNGCASLVGEAWTLTGLAADAIGLNSDDPADSLAGSELVKGVHESWPEQGECSRVEHHIVHQGHRLEQLEDVATHEREIRDTTEFRSIQSLNELGSLNAQERCVGKASSENRIEMRIADSEVDNTMGTIRKGQLHQASCLRVDRRTLAEVRFVPQPAPIGEPSADVGLFILVPERGAKQVGFRAFDSERPSRSVERPSVICESDDVLLKDVHKVSKVSDYQTRVRESTRKRPQVTTDRVVVPRSETSWEAYLVCKARDVNAAPSCHW